MKLTKTETMEVECQAIPLALGSAIVELDVFSGRPNPRWALDAGALIILQDMIAGLECALVAIEMPSQLGYRGLSVWAEERHGLAELLYVGGGYVFLQHEKALPSRIDRHRSIERKVLESGIGNVDPALLNDILAALP